MVTANINLICSARLWPRLNIVKSTLKGRTTCNNYHGILRGYKYLLKYFFRMIIYGLIKVGVNLWWILEKMKIFSGIYIQQGL